MPIEIFQNLIKIIKIIIKLLLAERSSGNEFYRFFIDSDRFELLSYLGYARDSSNKLGSPLAGTRFLRRRRINVADN